jgi:hypothetical protein
MKLDQSGQPTPQLVRSIYLAELMKYYQRKAGAKFVSPDYAESRVKRLDTTGERDGQNFWTKLTSYCIAGNLDVGRLIKAFFYTQDSIRNYMLLKHTDIFSRNVLPVYESMKPSVDLCKNQLEAQKKVLMMHADRQLLINGTPREQSAQLALETTTAPYCALFRYCMLSSMGLDPSPWTFSAIRQYAPDHKSYDAAWAGFIPEPLKAMANVRRAS